MDRLEQEYKAMKVDRSLFPDKRLVIDRVSGPVTTEELWDNLVSLFEDPDYECGFSGVYDLRDAVSHINREIFMEFVKKVANSDEFGKSRWAIIVTQPLLTAYAEIFRYYVSEEVTIGLFCTTEAAASYINVEPDLI
jgi:hypothetical protein